MVMTNGSSPTLYTVKLEPVSVMHSGKENEVTVGANKPMVLHPELERRSVQQDLLNLNLMLALTFDSFLSLFVFRQIVHRLCL